MNGPESEDPFFRDLRLMIGTRDLEWVRLLLDSGAGVNSRDIRGMTPLMWAAARGHIPTLELLIERGADVNAISNDGRSALMRAATYGHTDAVQLLIDSGADVNDRTPDGRTALSSTKSALHPEEAVAALRAAGALEAI